jgi:hypothetical protein
VVDTVRMPWLLFSVGALGVLAALGCAGTPTNCGEGTVAKDKECVADGGDTSADTDADPTPVISSFTSDVAGLTEGGSVTFTVAVTDPQGVADVIGGTLLGGDGETYGTFSTTGGGLFTLTQTWAQLEAAKDITFTDEEQRLFTARFSDAAGHLVLAQTTVRLQCGGDGACSGVCTDLMADRDNCGTCGHQCTDDSFDTCEEGVCPVMSDCVEDFAGETCTTICTGQGYTGCLDTPTADPVGEAYVTDLTCPEFDGTYDSRYDVLTCNIDLGDFLRADLVLCVCADAG